MSINPPNLLQQLPVTIPKNDRLCFQKKLSLLSMHQQLSKDNELRAEVLGEKSGKLD